MSDYEETFSPHRTYNNDSAKCTKCNVDIIGAPQGTFSGDTYLSFANLVILLGRSLLMRTFNHCRKVNNRYGDSVDVHSRNHVYGAISRCKRVQSVIHAVVRVKENGAGRTHTVHTQNQKE
jgi:hypothetical protein